jgi:hypothetical protein
MKGYCRYSQAVAGFWSEDMVMTMMSMGVCVVHGQGDSPTSQLQAVRRVKHPVLHDEDRDTRQTLQFPCQRQWNLYWDRSDRCCGRTCVLGGNLQEPKSVTWSSNQEHSDAPAEACGQLCGPPSPTSPSSRSGWSERLFLPISHESR